MNIGLNELTTIIVVVIAIIVLSGLSAGLAVRLRGRPPQPPERPRGGAGSERRPSGRPRDAREVPRRRVDQPLPGRRDQLPDGEPGEGDGPPP